MSGEHTFEGYSTDSHQTDVPMAYLVDSRRTGTRDLILQKDGDVAVSTTAWA